ncbi:MAG: SDR family oxidoreductase [Rhodococcus sp. (in: high G+C Gram-positive bacteria)]|nr:MAG: SDR family oxidoreductase [Rhodococcus sp. (in: high G+C Gram-positive bacteria)]
MSELVGRRIIVTGGASGMGEGIVRAFTKMGAAVVSLDVNTTLGSAIADEAGASFQSCDVSDETSVHEAFAAATATLGGLDVLVHAAGVAPAAPAAETDVELWQQVLAVNATGTFLTNRAAFPHLKENGGRIINFASAAGMNGYPGKSAYAAAKGAVLAWTRSIATEWAPFGITANAMAPMIWTSMYDKTRSEMSPEQLAAHDAKIRAMIPIGGKLGDIQQDLVPVVAFLSGEGSRFMTGQTFSVDGGKNMVR